MSLPEDLLQLASRLIEQLDQSDPDEAAMRRAVSTCYYALFHQLNADAAGLVAPNVTFTVNHRIQRWFDHAEMRKVCARFLRVTLDQPLLGLIGPTSSRELQRVCRIFIQLQDARHRADYDLDYVLTSSECFEFLEATQKSTTTWKAIKDSAEANIFILSLLLWKNWDRERL